MAAFALGSWGFYDKDGNRLELDLPNTPDPSGYFEGQLNFVVIVGHWNSQTNEIAWQTQPRPTGPPIRLNPSPSYEGQGFPIKTPIQLMTGLERPSQLQIIMAQRFGLQAPTPQPWVAVFEGPLP